ncbi:MAG TPA: VWA domain-containing protein [Polyangia bacterium]|jgi:hypothetical protein|nr:VWA domain-containing protein [Polyangia bacterium]
MRRSGHPLALAAAIAACAGCFGGESLGDHHPAGSGGSGVSSTGGTNGMSGAGDTGSAGGTGGEIGEGGSSGPAQFCGSVASYPEPALRSDILIVLDRSSSMNDDSNEVGCQGGCGPSSKFAVLSAALDQLVHENPSVNWGLAFFPSDDACGVTAGAAVDVSPDAPSAIESELPTMMPGAGDAPTAAAINAAAAYLQSRLDMNAKYILLATDGRSGCATDTDAENAITGALSAGIPTFVVGIVPSSDTAGTATLNQLAVLGGEPAQGTASDFLTIADLGPSLAPMPSSAVSCDLYLPFPIGTGTMLQIQAIADGGSVLVDIPQDSINGWSFTSPDPDGVVLNGAACASTMDGSYTQFEISYGCSGPPPLARARPSPQDGSR